MMHIAAKSICAKVDEYARLKIQIEELNSKAEAIADQLKGMMTEKGIDEMTAGNHVVTYKAVDSRRLDTAALKKILSPEALEPLMKVTSTRRFSVK